MNLIYLKYAVEVAESGGLNKAAENLFIAPSNLSRAIKELEKDLNFSIFERTSKGMTLTEEGNEFLSHAKAVISQINDIEQMYKRRSDSKLRLSVSVPRAAYFRRAFTELKKKISCDTSALYYKETNSSSTLESLLNCTCDIGIIRSAKRYDSYFYDYISEKGISGEVITEYKYVLICSRNSVLAKLDRVTQKDLLP